MKTQNNIILGGVALIIIVLSVGNWWFKKSLTEERIYTQTLYAELAQIKHEKDSVSYRADSIQVILDRYEALVDSFELVDESSRLEIDRLRMKLSEALADVQGSTPDENYSLLQGMYITTDTLEYAFSGEQVSSIAEDVVVGDGNKSLISTYEDHILFMRGRLAVSDEVIVMLTQENNNLDLLAQKLYNDIALKTEDCNVLVQENKRLKKALRMWQAGSLGAGGFILLVLLIL